MRFLELDLRAFGPFTDRRVDLSGGDRGLHVLYGANEAGKSSMLRAIEAALFGIPLRSVDNFVHPHPEMRVGATLRAEDGTTLAFLRRKTRTGALRDAATDEELPDDALAPFLAGLDDASWRRLWMIDHAGLRAGGEMLRATKGLAGESLFAAGLGLHDVMERVAALDAEAKKIHSGSKASELKVAKKAYDDARHRRDEATIRSGAWESLRRDVLAARERRDGIEAELRAARVRRHRLERLAAAARAARDEAQAAAALAALVEGDPEACLLPEGYSRERRIAAQTQQEEATTESQRRRDRATRARADRDAIADPGLLADPTVAAALETLRDGLAARRSAAKGEAGRRRELVEAEAERIARGAELGDVDEGAMPDAAAIARLRAAASEGATCRAELRAAERELAAAERELAALGAPPAAAPEAEAIARLRDAIRAARDAGDPAKRSAEAGKRAEASRHRAETLRAALAGFAGDLEALRAARPPAPGVLEGLAEEHAQRRESEERRRSDAERLAVERREARRAADEARAGDAPPGAAALEEARERRDRDFDGLITAWAEGAAAPDGMEHRALVRDADEIADRLRREADRAARLEAAERRLRQLEEEVAALEKRDAAGKEAQAQWAIAWREAWAPASIDDPGSPESMREWLATFEEARRALAEGDAEEAQAAEAAREAEALAARLRAAQQDLAPRGEAAPDPGDLALADRLAAAQRGLDAAEEQDRAVAAHAERVRVATARRDDARGRREAAEAVATEWSRGWERAVAAIGAEPSIEPDEARARLDALVAWREARTREQRLAREVAADAAEATAFAEQVATLVAEHAPDLAEEAPEAAAATVIERGAAAREAADARARLLERARDEEAAAREANERAEAAGALLAAHAGMAGVADPADLPEHEARAEQVAAQLARRAAARQQLEEAADGEDRVAFAAEAASLDPDDRAAEQEAADERIESLEKERRAAEQALFAAQNALEAVDGSGAAAEADQEMIAVAAAIDDGLRRYARLRLAAAWARHAIERHRAETQDPLLAAASAQFAALTLGSFSGLRVEHDADGAAAIVGERPETGALLAVDAMSDGTRDQLDLALRLAYLERRIEHGEPMPLVVDDILINFDDDRARATLELLARLSERTQVILLTHHARIAELAAGITPTGRVVRHALGT